MKRLIYIAFLFLITIFSGCMTCMSEMCLGKDTYERLMNSKPYGAHWIKDGMTRESRLVDYKECGGGADLREGYEVRQGQSNKEFFDGFNAHTYQLLSCMKSKGYVYRDQCDASCLHP